MRANAVTYLRAGQIADSARVAFLSSGAGGGAPISGSGAVMTATLATQVPGRDGGSACESRGSRTHTSIGLPLSTLDKSGLARPDRSGALLTAAGPGGRVRPVSRRSRGSWQLPP